MGDVAGRFGNIKEDKDFCTMWADISSQSCLSYPQSQVQAVTAHLCSFLTVNGIDAIFVRRDARARLAVGAGVKQARG